MGQVEIASPGPLVISNEASEDALHLVDGSLHLTVSLGVVSGRQTGGGADQTTEGLPKSGSKLGSSVQDNVLREPVQSD